MQCKVQSQLTSCDPNHSLHRCSEGTPGIMGCTITPNTDIAAGVPLTTAAFGFAAAAAGLPFANVNPTPTPTPAITTSSTSVRAHHSVFLLQPQQERLLSLLPSDPPAETRTSSLLYFKLLAPPPLRGPPWPYVIPPVLLLWPPALLLGLSWPGDRGLAAAWCGA